MAFYKRNTGLIAGILAVVILVLLPGYAQAQWPPFSFALDSVYQDGKITYNIRFARKVDWPMADVVFKIPLPEGTRFLNANAPETTGTDFDGSEVTFFTPTLHRRLKDVSFVVEVTDTAKTQFTTHTWIAWKGDVPGDYLTKDTTIDITRLPLNWSKPKPRLRLDAAATSTGNKITYTLYPMNVGTRRMWDLTISVPLPPGATFVSSQAQTPFKSGFDGQQVVFSALELERRAVVEPLRFQISITDVATPLAVTQAWAQWNNVGRNVDQTETTKTGEIIVQAGAAQRVVTDPVGDTPFSNYDLTGIAFQPDGATAKALIYTAGAMGPIGEPIEHYIYLDADCSAETGKAVSRYGADYRVRYRHQNGKAYLYTWNAEASKWDNRKTIAAQPSEGTTTTVWIPGGSVDATASFCWLALSRNRTEAYHPNPPTERSSTDPRLARYIAPASNVD